MRYCLDRMHQSGLATPSVHLMQDREVRVAALALLGVARSGMAEAHPA